MRRLLGFALLAWLALVQPGLAAWTVGNTQSAQAVASANSASLTKPTGITSGDLLYMVLDVGSTAPGGADPGSPTLPTGWSITKSDFQTGSFKNAQRLTRALKVATGSEPASYSVSWTNAGTFSWSISDISPPTAGQTVALDVAGTGTKSGSSAAPVSPSVSPVNAGDLWIAVVGDSGSGGTVTFPGGFTSVVNFTNNSDTAGFSFGFKILVSSGATGTASWTLAFPDVVIPGSDTFSATSAAGAVCGTLPLMGVGC